MDFEERAQQEEKSMQGGNGDSRATQAKSTQRNNGDGKAQLHATAIQQANEESKAQHEWKRIKPFIFT